MAPETAPPQLDRLRTRLAEIADLEYAGALLAWDQSVWMPPGGAGARAEQLATLERLVHARLTDPEHGRLLHALEPWVAGLDPDADEAWSRSVAATSRRPCACRRRSPSRWRASPHAATRHGCRRANQATSPASTTR